MKNKINLIIRKKFIDLEREKKEFLKKKLLYFL